MRNHFCPTLSGEHQVNGLRCVGVFERFLPAVMVAMLFWPVVASGKTIYRGIGNDEFADDIDYLAACLAPCLGCDDRDLRVKNKTGAEICALVAQDALLCEPGDIYIFHYSGHGYFQDDDDVGEDPRDNDETIGLNGIGLTDDELAECMKGFPECCTVLVIMDSCHGGGFVGGTEDLDRSNIAVKDSLSMLATAEKQCTAPGESFLLRLLCEGIAKVGTTFAADGDGDGNLTMTEWFDYAAADTVHIENYYDWDALHDSYVLCRQPVIPTVSEWGLIVMTLLGLTGGTVTFARRRRPAAAE